MHFLSNVNKSTTIVTCLKFLKFKALTLNKVNFCICGLAINKVNCLIAGAQLLVGT